MKRFRSPFQKIQSIQQQLLRIAELKLVQAQTAVRKSEDKIMKLEGEMLRHEQRISQRMNSGRRGLTIRDLLADRTCLEDRREGIQREVEHLRQLKSVVAIAQSEYQALKAKSDGVDQMLEKRKLEHRRQSLQNEQNELDESARGLKHRAGSHKDSDSALR